MAGWVLLTLFLAIIVALIFWLEWMGSERPQQMVDLPIALPTEKAKTE